MNLKFNSDQIISLESFELGWRFEHPHNSSISEKEKELIHPFTESESKRLNKIIDYFELEDNLIKEYKSTEWIIASSENANKENDFREKLESLIKSWNEKVIITWHRKLTLETSKEILIKYWSDFLYPGSDDVTIISTDTKGVLFYNHVEIVKIWNKL